MISRSIFFAVLCAIFLGMFADQAEAKRRGGGGFIYIPGIGWASEKIVKVKELPDIPQLRRNDGTYVDLGYLHKQSGGGEWIGYIGSSDRYISLSSDELKTMMRYGGIYTLPPAPERKVGWEDVGPVGFIVLAIILLGLGKFILFSFAEILPKRRGPKSALDFDAQIRDAVRRQNGSANEPTSPTAAPVRRSPTSPRRAPAGGGFGRRGL